MNAAIIQKYIASGEFFEFPHCKGDTVTFHGAQDEKRSGFIVTISIAVTKNGIGTVLMMGGKHYLQTDGDYEWVIVIHAGERKSYNELYKIGVKRMMLTETEKMIF